MKKILLSLSGGLVFGLILSFLFWDYRGSTYDVKNQAGVDRTIREMDFDFIFKSSLLVIAIAVIIYLLWSYFDKKKHEKFLEEFNGDKSR